ncbi:hypothetical protein QR685DRAFT_156607 [Neurospora intermedia]|uniref:Uncharacterized protein n=1 Tax=Neurospora intermedia TaxID=5142 RepID=A0ABR3DM69_NEUIN
MHLSPTTQTHQPSPATQRPVNPAAWSLASTTWPAFFNVRYTTTNMTYHTSRPHKISTARHTEMKREFIARSLAWYWISNLVVMKSGLQRMNSGSPVSGDRTERATNMVSDRPMPLRPGTMSTGVGEHPIASQSTSLKRAAGQTRPSRNPSGRNRPPYGGRYAHFPGISFLTGKSNFSSSRTCLYFLDANLAVYTPLSPLGQSR